MRTFRRRVRRSVLGGGAILAALLTLGLTAPGASATSAAGRVASAPPGDNGTVVIHRSTTPVGDRRNEPHVCVFYLDAFGFDPFQMVSWEIKSWPPTGNKTTVSSGVLMADASGDAHTELMSLPNGHYKLFWKFAGEHGAAKHKVFWVACEHPVPPGTHGQPPGGGGSQPVHISLPVTG